MNGATNVLVMFLVLGLCHIIESHKAVSPNPRDLVYGKLWGNADRACPNPDEIYVNICGRCVVRKCPECYHFNPQTCNCDEIFRCRPHNPDAATHIPQVDSFEHNHEDSPDQIVSSDEEKDNDETEDITQEVETHKDDLTKGSHKTYTTDGFICVFPFIYKGVTHNACAPGSSGNSWCPTELMEDMTFEHTLNSWGRCRGPWFSSAKCGPRHALLDGRSSQCDPNGNSPCCNPQTGWCGNTRGHCECKRCIDYRKVAIITAPPEQYHAAQVSTTQSSKTLDKGSWVRGGRCGPRHRLPDGSPGQCNPQGEHPCCNQHSGWCGITQGHCECKGCIDYRKPLPVFEAGTPCTTLDVPYVEECGKCAECPNDCQKFDLVTCKCHMKPGCKANLAFEFIKKLLD